MCSINTVEIPKSCTSYIFCNVFEHCLKHYNMVVLGVYKRPDDSTGPLGEELWGSESTRHKTKSTSSTQQKAPQKAQAEQDIPGNSRPSSRDPVKPFVWLHPPKNIELLQNDELFVLSDRNLMADTMNKEDEAGGKNVDSSKILKNEEKKNAEANINKMRGLNKKLCDLSQASKDWEKDVEQSQKFINENFALKLRSDLEGFDNFT